MSAATTLTAGSYSVTADPTLGGRILAFRFDGVDAMAPVPGDGPRPPAAEAPSGGCFPLVPWSNRIRDARLTLDGRSIALPVTEPSAGHAIHGHGLRRVWDAEAGDGRVAMSYQHAGGGEAWPWSYTARQIVRLDKTGMTLSLSVINTSDAPMPAGLGQHPYFPRTDRTLVTLPVANAWPPTQAEKFPARGAQPLPPELDRTEEGPVPLGLDQGFGGWTGRARIVWPEQGLALTMTVDGASDHVIVYTPAHRPYFCIEPVTHVIDAANMAETQGLSGTGHHMLAPGEEMSLLLGFRIEVL